MATARGHRDPWKGTVGGEGGGGLVPLSLCPPPCPPVPYMFMAGMPGPASELGGGRIPLP